MKKSEISSLIGVARAFDDRIEDVADPEWNEELEQWEEDARLEAWQMVLGELDYGLAKAGLVELYRKPQMMRLQPGHIYEAAEKVRARNVSRTDPAILTPPDDLDAEGSGTTSSAKWKQAAMEAIGRGASLEQAEQVADAALGVQRRVLGPPVRRLELTERPRGLSGTG